jgi:hypothetical protein
MFESRSVDVQGRLSQAHKSNLRILTVQVQDGAKLDLTSFVDGKLSRESEPDRPLPATERHHYQIAK